MARSVIRLEGEEITYFHLNYIYMWKKLNTAPYYVNGSGELPNWIHSPELLPSYVNLSKCMNPEYVPSMNIVNKIVAFYNANITPEISTFQFLHEKLESTDDSRKTGGQKSGSQYCGLYYGYYYSGDPTKKQVYGTVVKIAEVNNILTAQMIAGFASEKDMKSMRVKSLFEKTDISVDAYKKFRESLDISKRRTTLYKGDVKITSQALTFQMAGIDQEGKMLFFNCAIDQGGDDTFYGGMGLLTFVGGRYDIHFLKHAIMRADDRNLVPLSFENEDLKDMLSISKLPNEHIHLSLDMNRDWVELILTNGRQ